MNHLSTRYIYYIVSKFVFNIKTILLYTETEIKAARIKRIAIVRPKSKASSYTFGVSIG